VEENRGNTQMLWQDDSSQ